MRRFFGIFYTVSKKGLITLSRSGRTIIVHIKQPQLNFAYIEELSESEEFKLYDNKYKSENSEFELSMTSFDYLYCLMAICSKIKAFDLFLDNHKDLENKVSLRMWIKEFENENIVKEINHNNINNNLNEKEYENEGDEKYNKMKMREIEEDKNSRQNRKEK